MSEDGRGSESARRRAPPAQLDPRRNAFRPDLAAESLYGKVSAPHYVQGFPAQVVRACRAAAQPAVAVVRLRDGSAVRRDASPSTRSATAGPGCSSTRDRYVGYVPADALSREIDHADAPRARARHLRLSRARHQIAAAHAPQPQCRAERRRRRRALLRARRRRLRRHAPRRSSAAATRTTSSRSPSASSARPTCGAGARGSASTARASCRSRWRRPASRRRATPTCSRPSSGATSPIADVLEGLQRGDLVFWKGHVGIMADSVTLVHANAHHMAVDGRDAARGHRAHRQARRRDRRDQAACRVCRAPERARLAPVGQKRRSRSSVPSSSSVGMRCGSPRASRQMPPPASVTSVSTERSSP